MRRRGLGIRVTYGTYRMDLAALLGVVWCVAFVVLGSASWGAGDWPEPRQNPHLTGIQPLAGRMTAAPVVSAQYDLGRSQPRVTGVTLPDGGQVGLCIVAGALDAYDTAGTLLWQSHPPGLNFLSVQQCGDFNGDGNIEIALQAGRPADPYGAAVLVAAKDGAVLWRYDVEPMSYSWSLHLADYLPESGHDEIVVIMTGYPPDKDNGYIALFAFTGNDAAPLQKWRYDFSDYTCYPSLLQTDLDGDGRKELVVETHSRMWFLDSLTGQLKHFAKWDVSPANMRSYGLVEFADLDKDGREDFLCIANFAQHHEVLLNQNGEMKPAWVHGWADNVTTTKVATRWMRPGYLDVDGGGFEVVVSMFNSEQEGAWLVRGYDALTGELKYRLPGMIVVAHADIDADGKEEILANACAEPTGTVMTGARLLKAIDGTLQTVWSDDGATAIEPKGDAPLRVQRGQEPFGLRWENGAGALEPWTREPKQVKADFAAVPAIQGPSYSLLLAADLLGDAANEIVVYSMPSVTVIEGKEGALRAAARYESTAIPVIADLNGDGKQDLVRCAIRPDALPVVEAITPSQDNAPLWTSTFPPSDRTGLPAQRMAYMRAGHFTGKPGPDVYVWAGTPLTRSTVLDGRSGALLWDRGETPEVGRYWGPSVNYASTCDYDGDGNEDLIFTNPDYYCVASGPTGAPLLGPLFPPNIFNQPSQGLYTYPVILDAPTGPIVCLVSGHYFQGVMSLRAEPKWYVLPMAGESRCASEGFLRLADGAWLMGFGRQNGKFACVNVADGSLRWEMPLDASCSDVATGDVDGDGAFEFVFGTSHGALYAVGDGGATPRLVWKVDVGPALEAPILGDVNGDGASEIVVPASDGYIRVFAAQPA